MKNSERFFSNTDCKYYPCHSVEEGSDFNCLFCYCPLYLLGEKCGGNYTITKSGKKSCINCTIPHDPDRYDELMDKIKATKIVDFFEG